MSMIYTVHMLMASVTAVTLCATHVIGPPPVDAYSSGLTMRDLKLAELNQPAGAPSGSLAPEKDENISLIKLGQVFVHSNDGEIDGVLMHSAPPGLANAERWTARQAQTFTRVAIRLGQTNPEWGVYKDLGRKPVKLRKDLGALLALGVGTVGGEGYPLTYRLLFPSYTAYSPPLDPSGGVYAQTAVSLDPQSTCLQDGGKLTLEKCLPDTQTLIDERPVKYDESRDIVLLERHYTPPSISNAGKFPIAAISAATAELIKDGLLRPVWGLYCPGKDPKEAKLVFQGEQQNGRTFFHQVGNIPNASASEWSEEAFEVDDTGTLVKTAGEKP